MMIARSELVQHDGVRLTIANFQRRRKFDRCHRGPQSRRDLLPITSDDARLAREWRQIQVP